MTDLAAAVAKARERLGEGPFVGIVLGSGLGDFADRLVDPVKIAYEDLAGFPTAGVTGHAGALMAGSIGDTRCMILQGRAHLYEGHSADAVAHPVRVLVRLGLKALIVTNAAGAANQHFRAGTLMRIEDHINLQWWNPLAGPVQEGEVRFPDMSEPYSEELGLLAERIASEAGVRLERGVYCAVPGPSYETPAEVRAFRRLGADAVGMSTVPEVLVARAAGVPVLGLSVITNAGAGMRSEPLSHDEVVRMGAAVREDLGRVLDGVVRALGRADP